ncbi:daunorubicin/doxorubicin resistance ABC transporter ATP-binding protein DrrA [Gordonia sp. HS-NH1]|uniref:daunorubicin/doxorubicin resistance ABC transporter ATP-binding protein DrrA n=1 Tax=Gordonia sp. HS-NH1 TaxID=1435068 RepID=UPI0006E3459D|nr:daunorubicin/doxorubicin resistance ABC transporter ATP-binding protein DrrA [Gordonia sp. HS-NH1]
MTAAADIEISGLTKSYGEHRVLDGIDLHVPAGGVTALLGPNGSGKTTTVGIASTLFPADSGTVTIGGYDTVAQTRSVRAIIGVTGQSVAVDDLFSGRDNLALIADLRRLGRRSGRARTQELIEQFDLVEAADRPVSTYSGGMRRRLDLAMTLVAIPRVIFLDEPTTGLDPRSRRMLWETISRLAADGVTIFLTTQYLEEADHLADRIAVLDHGHIVAEGTAAELKSRVHASEVRLTFADRDSLDAAASLLPDARRVTDSRRLDIATDDTVATIRTTLNRLEAAGVPVADVSVHAPTLDDVFFALTGNPAPEVPDPDQSGAGS